MSPVSHCLHLLGDAPSDEMGVHAHAAHSSDLEEALHEVVVTRIEVEPGGDDVPRLLEIVICLLHCAHGLDLREA